MFGKRFGADLSLARLKSEKPRTKNTKSYEKSLIIIINKLCQFCWIKYDLELTILGCSIYVSLVKICFLICINLFERQNSKIITKSTDSKLFWLFCSLGFFCLCPPPQLNGRIIFAPPPSPDARAIFYIMIYYVMARAL